MVLPLKHVVLPCEIIWQPWVCSPVPPHTPEPEKNNSDSSNRLMKWLPPGTHPVPKPISLLFWYYWDQNTWHRNLREERFVLFYGFRWCHSIMARKAHQGSSVHSGSSSRQRLVTSSLKKESQNQGLSVNIKGLLLVTYFQQVKPSS